MNWWGNWTTPPGSFGARPPNWIRQAIEYYLYDCEDISRAILVLVEPAGPVLDWKSARRDMIGQP